MPRIGEAGRHGGADQRETEQGAGAVNKYLVAKATRAALRGKFNPMVRGVGGQETADWLRRVGLQLAEVIEQVQIVHWQEANDDN